jgi:hypothetical protein
MRVPLQRRPPVKTFKIIRTTDGRTVATVEANSSRGAILKFRRSRAPYEPYIIAIESKETPAHE